LSSFDELRFNRRLSCTREFSTRLHSFLTCFARFIPNVSTNSIDQGLRRTHRSSAGFGCERRAGLHHSLSRGNAGYSIHPDASEREAHCAGKNSHLPMGKEHRRKPVGDGSRGVVEKAPPAIFSTHQWKRRTEEVKPADTARLSTF